MPNYEDRPKNCITVSDSWFAKMPKCWSEGGADDADAVSRNYGRTTTYNLAWMDNIKDKVRIKMYINDRADEMEKFAKKYHLRYNWLGYGVSIIAITNVVDY